MDDACAPRSLCQDGIAAPLRYPVFRRIWFASLLSNLGLLIQGVGAAWAMTQMATSADKVALVQTALLLPVMLVSMPAGALADMHDRRIVALVSLGIALIAATVLTTLAWIELFTPNVLLMLCFAVGSGMALMGPAWQSSVSEQVPAGALPSAIALNGISYNIARSLGPAIGGIVVATAGAVAAFALSVLLYLPLMFALFRWKRVSETPRLPPESLGRAMASGRRYISNSPPLKILLTRSMLTGVIGGVITALMPLVARDILHGGAETYGLMLGVFGMGAVVGALLINEMRERMNAERAIQICSLLMAVAIATVALSRKALLTDVALMVAGAVWMMMWALFNIGVQFSAPRWVVGRALAAYQAAASGGVAIGSWGWGHLTNNSGVETALLVSSGLMLASVFVGKWMRIPEVDARDDEGEMLDHPQVRLPLTEHSGPVIIEIQYRIVYTNVRTFHKVMHEIQLFRQRNGAYDWSLACDIADPDLWTERFRCRTWLDYLRQRNRSTTTERALDRQAISLHSGPEPVLVRRMLARVHEVVGR